MIWLILLVVGLCFGSFVNALVGRLREKQLLDEQIEQLELKKLKPEENKRIQELSAKKGEYSMLTGRSRCFACGHALAVKDLIPIYSWLTLRGKCRYCGTKFADTPLAELLVPLTWLLSYGIWPRDLTGGAEIALFIVWLAALVAFVALFIYDLHWKILPDKITLPLIAVGLIWRILLAAASIHPLNTLLAGFWGVVVLAGVFYGLFELSGGNWIGGGDVKLAVTLGLLTGGPLMALFLLFIASISGTIVSLPFAAASGRLSRAGGVKVPFGPFLLFAVYICVLFGPALLNQYANLFGLYS